MKKNFKKIFSGVMAFVLFTFTGCDIDDVLSLFNKDEYIEQNEFNENDKTLIEEYTDKNIPFASCYSYDVREKVITIKYLEITFTTSEEAANEYQVLFNEVCPLDVDTSSGSIYYADSDVRIIYQSLVVESFSVISLKFYKVIDSKEHEHTFASTYSYDETYHWYASTCGHEDVTKGKEKHTFGKASIKEEATQEKDGIKTYTCSKCGYVKEESYTLDNDGFLDATDFTNAEKEIIANYFTGNVPFVKCYEYEVSEEEDEDGYYAAITFVTTSELYEDYYNDINDLYPLTEYSFEFFGYEYTVYYNEDNDQTIELSYEEDGDDFYVYLTLYPNDGGDTPSYDDFLSATDFTNAEKETLANYFTGNIPFVKCYEYEVSEEEDEDGYYASITFVTTSELFEDYYNDVNDLYPLTEYTYEIFGFEFTMYYNEDNDQTIELSYEEDGDYCYVYVTVYNGYEEEKDPEETESIVLNVFTMENVTSKYSSFTETIGGVDFVLNDIMISSDKNLTNFLQAKKNTSYIYNDTAFDSLSSITIVYAKNSGSGKYVEFDIASGDDMSSLTSTYDNREETPYYSGENEYLQVTYTFDVPVSYIKFTSTKAVFFMDITFGAKSGGQGGTTGKVDLVDDGNGYSTVDFTKGKVKNVTELGDYIDGCPTTGDVNVLVIPVEFPDCTAASKGYSVETLNQAFNGKEDNSYLYYSVANYLNLSSYGNLNITFDVVDSFIKTKYNSSEYKKAYEGKSNKLGTYYDYYGYSSKDNEGTYATSEMVILNECLSYLDTTLDYDLSKYDSDDNGTIDAVVMIYTQDIDDDYFWAWRYWNMLGNPNEYYDPDDKSQGYNWYMYDDVYANDYLWASYQFLFEDEDGEEFNSYDTINTYTFIHEFSHILGADDYYDYSGESSPLDGYDIMDYESGDHNMFTKALFGWYENARIITTSDTVTLTLEAMENKADAIILANSFDEEKGMFQEYFIIQYYTNTGLFTKDGSLFDDNGIVVYHVNASITYDSDYEGYYLDYNNTTYTTDTTYGTDNNLIEIIKNGKDYVFTTGDSLGTVKFDNNTTLGFNFTVDSLDADKATITFTRTVKEAK